jgi:TonB family protein
MRGMNFVEGLIEAFVTLLGSLANAIEQGVSAFVSRLQRIAHELTRFFVRMVKWAAQAIHSLWIIVLFFTAMSLALCCFMEMGYADYWLISWSGWALFVLTILLLVAALLRMASPSQYDTQKKQHMGIPLLLVNIAFLATIFVTLSSRPLRSPVLSWMNATGKSEQSRSGLLAAASTPQQQGTVLVKRKKARITPTNPAVPPTAVPHTTPVPKKSQPAELLSCTAATSANYTPVRVLEKVNASRPPGGGDAVGEVEVSGTVDREGTVHGLGVSRSALVPEFGDEAVRAVGKWRFAPALWNGAPTDCRLKVIVAFEPKQP